MARTSTILAAVAMGLALAAAAGCADEDTPLDAGAGDGTTPSTEPAPVAATPPDGDPFMHGAITNVSVFQPVTDDCTPPEDLDPDGAVSSDDPPVCSDPDDPTLGTVLVEEVPGVQEGNKISLGVEGGETTVLRKTGTDYEVIGFDDLAEGQQVDVWVDGPVAESYPLQGSASAIVVTG